LTINKWCPIKYWIIHAKFYLRQISTPWRLTREVGWWTRICMSNFEKETLTVLSSNSFVIEVYLLLFDLVYDYHRQFSYLVEKYMHHQKINFWKMVKASLNSDYAPKKNQYSTRMRFLIVFFFFKLMSDKVSATSTLLEGAPHIVHSLPYH
jgi:hypothetical protein